MTNTVHESARVSVLCAAYNQKPYIRKMLDGLVMQKTDFPVEFLIHDDASTDGTAEIISEYADRYPDRIIPFLDTENQYQKGNNFLFTQLLPAAKGKYLAICEGDDYWTDPTKLQRQYDAMETHPECCMCVHKAQGISENDSKKIRTFPQTDEKEGVVDTDSFIHRLLADREWIFHTTSYFLKTDVLKQAVRDRQTFFLSAMYPDHGMLLLGVYGGGLYYIDRCMSAYRMQAKGGVTNKNIRREADQKRRTMVAERAIRSLEHFDLVTENRYHTDIQKFLDYQRCIIEECRGNYSFLLQKDMCHVFRQFPKRVRFRICIASCLPFFDRLYFWIRERLRRL